MEVADQTVTLQIGEGQLTVPKESLMLAWLSLAVPAVTPRQPARAVLHIGEESEEVGGIYAGIARGLNGAPDYHLFVLSSEGIDLSWDAANTWAADQDGTLPTRAEQALLYANLKDLFQPSWYWSAEQHASLPSNAWTQYFDLGNQGYLGKSYEGRARAVRRLIIK